jgi:hypothetical protein
MAQSRSTTPAEEASFIDAITKRWITGVSDKDCIAHAREWLARNLSELGAIWHDAPGMARLFWNEAGKLWIEREDGATVQIRDILPSYFRRLMTLREGRCDDNSFIQASPADLCRAVHVALAYRGWIILEEELPAGAIPPAPQADRPRIICISGSTRFIDQIALVAWDFEKGGDIAIGPHLLPRSAEIGDSHQAEKEGVKDVLDRLHLAKIDLCDQVFVVNPGGYIGDSTAAEIAYAQETGKPVAFLVEPLDMSELQQPSGIAGGLRAQDLETLGRGDSVHDATVLRDGVRAEVAARIGLKVGDVVNMRAASGDDLPGAPWLGLVRWVAGDGQSFSIVDDPAAYDIARIKVVYTYFLTLQVPAKS